MTDIGVAFPHRVMESFMDSRGGSDLIFASVGGPWDFNDMTQ